MRGLRSVVALWLLGIALTSSRAGIDASVCGDGTVQPPETCEPPGAFVSPSNCCLAHPGPGCDDPTCRDAICFDDPFCCVIAWDSICSAAAANDAACAQLCAICREDCTSCGDISVQTGEECDPPGQIWPTHDCCTAHGGLGCSSLACRAGVCALDPVCCNIGWDSICVDEAAALGCCPAVCQVNTCCVDSDADGICDAADGCPLTPNPQGASDCCTAHGGLGCSDPGCQAVICSVDMFCCSVAWDAVCAGQALRDELCLASCGGAAFLQTVSALSPTSFGWLAPADVVWARGDLSNLSFYGEDASGSVPAATSLPAPEVPAPGTALWWLVRPDCPGGSWSSGGPAECGTTATCPGGNRNVNLP